MNLLSLDTQKADIKSELTDLEAVEAPPRPAFDSAMRAFDILVAVPALLATGIMAVLIVLLNPLLNPGPLFYKQRRMGLGGRPFVIWKFRTMTDAASEGPGRLPHDEVEHHRITPLGRFLRSTRIDELPNFINVVKGDMSVIGPRPDTWGHAVIFVQTVPYYSNRLRVRPGVTGLAQVRGGYADNPKAIERKARFDHHYVRRACLPLALHIIWRTIWVMVSGRGAK